MRRQSVAVLLIGLLVLLSAPLAAAKPARIVTMNLCADQLVLELADPGSVLSVSALAADPTLSNVTAKAGRLPRNFGRAEEVLQYEPDLVVSGFYLESRTNAMLERLGVPVMVLGYANSLDDSRALIRRLAARLGETARGEAMIQAMEQRLAAVAAARRSPARRALVYAPNGYSSGRETVANEIMAIAGLRNIAPDLGLEQSGRVPVELLLQAAPEFLIFDRQNQAGNSLAERLLQHPALKSLEGKLRIVPVPTRAWLCPGPWVAEAAEILARETR